MHSHYTLPCTFYARDPRDVAHDLLGKILVRRLGAIYLKVMITETEVIMGQTIPPHVHMVVDAPSLLR